MSRGRRRLCSWVNTQVKNEHRLSMRRNSFNRDTRRRNSTVSLTLTETSNKSVTIKAPQGIWEGIPLAQTHVHTRRLALTETANVRPSQRNKAAAQNKDAQTQQKNTALSLALTHNMYLKSISNGAVKVVKSFINNIEECTFCTCIFPPWWFIIIYFIFQQSPEGTITAPWDIELVSYSFLYKHSQGLFVRIHQYHTRIIRV